MHEKITHIEYACYDNSITEIETRSNVEKAYKLGIKNIGIFPYSVPTVKTVVDDPACISISVPVDFPYGLSDIKTRNFAVAQACKQKIQKVDLFIPSKILTNRKYDKLREDIRSNLEICSENNIQLRYILEYRIFSHEVLAKACAVLIDLGVDTILPSSGHMIDDINDNLIACNYLNTKTNIKTICNGNIYNEKQAQSVKNANLYGLRLHYINSIDLFLNTN